MDQAGLLANLIIMFKGGDVWVICIAVSLSISAAFVFERFIRLYLHYNVDGASFMFEVQKYILANDVDGAIRLCNGAGRAALPKVIKAGLQRASRGDDQIQNAIDAASLEMIPKLERRLPYLALIANISTLFGLLGTISGLIKAFAAIGVADPAQRSAILSTGISQAMNATAFGLVTAIFTMIMHSVLTNKANKILEEIDEFGVKLLDLLSARKYRQAGGKAE
jgi:biopolymer transport protein ExbB